VRVVALVRHGEEQCGGEGEGCGLSARGRAEAEAARDLLEPLGAPTVWSSPARPALETAAAIAGAGPVRLLPGLGERGPDLAAAAAALREAREAPGHLVLVGHRMGHALVLAEVLGMPPEAAGRVQQDTGAVSLLLEDRRGHLRAAAVNLTPLDPLRRAVAAVRAG
jgi:broad specificity phosphatase PhoE